MANLEAELGFGTCSAKGESSYADQCAIRSTRGIPRHTVLFTSYLPSRKPFVSLGDVREWAGPDRMRCRIGEDQPVKLLSVIESEDV